MREEKWSLVKESQVCAGVDEDTDRASEEMASEETSGVFTDYYTENYLG